MGYGIAPNLIIKEIRRIGRAVHHSEKEYFKWRGKKSLSTSAAIETAAPNKGYYQRTNLFLFNLFLFSIDLPLHKRFVDLGHGFGGHCFIAKNYFKNVTGIEGDEKIFELSKESRSNLGSRYKSVDLKFGNFLEEDLSPFDVIYFARPFLENFEKLMGDKLLEAKPGTTVISYIYGDHKYGDLFPSQGFRKMIWDPSSVFLLYERIEDEPD